MPRFTQLPVFRPHRFSLLPGSAAQARGCRAAVAVLAAAGLTVAYAGTAQASPRASAASAQTQPLPIYLNTHYSFAQRAADLVSRMTLAEKVQQLHTNSAPAIPMSIEFDSTMRLPINFAAAFGFSASASASARTA